MVARRGDELFDKGEELYEKYAKPLEREHWGEYVAISRDGRVVLGPDYLDVSLRAFDQLGTGSFVFKVGEKSVGKIR